MGTLHAHVCMPWVCMVQVQDLFTQMIMVRGNESVAIKIYLKMFIKSVFGAWGFERWIVCITGSQSGPKLINLNI